ncbi:uncharacterized protein si:ch211-149e23.4 isoform X2 [Etheostoma cragini]|uniref:uncharacterized protein si:ch211-149e23.4 isoform X2 n=1 Tax=Etheostoma cragini TaxID=417921 RepID=UPI00155E1258|nr:uncharacterized protein si:ch211-149e23.4 isoform X2 [Etheostoma cragini]
MGCSELLVLGFLLNFAHCLEILDRDPNLEIPHNLTAVLGEDAYLSCRYLGEHEILSAQWKRQINSIKSKRLAGFTDGKPFGRSDFSKPASPTNLTVQINVSSVEVEGQYICEFKTEEDDISDSLFLTVVARPDVQILVNSETINGSQYQSVSCSAVGGRPVPQISWSVKGRPPSDYFYTVNVSETAHSNGTSTLSSILRFPTHLQEEDSVICSVQHPTLQNPKLTTARVETYNLSGKLGSYRDNFQDPESLELQEGQSDTVISLQVTGNVPHYTVTCKKDDGPLPERVELVGNSSLIVQGPVEHQHAGLYECVFSYHQLNATLTFNVTVKPHHTQPVAPTVRVDLQTEDGYRVIKCSAADAVPAANMSWLLPEGVSGVSWFNFTSHNGSHSVKGVLLLPACTPWELTAVCVINHPAFEEPENRSMTLPHCARPHIAINSSTEWKDGEEYTKVDCFVDSVAPAATITWHAGNGYNSISSVHVSLSEMEVQADGLIRARSSAHFLSSLYSGQNVTCRVEHPSLEAPEKRALQILVHKAPVLSVSVARQEDSHLWLAVCDCRGEGVGTNLAWVLPENAKGQTSLHSTYEGRVIKARLTYQFPLAYHEGQDLTCVYHFENGATEKKTVHIPRYYISSVKVLNHTTPLQSRYSGETIVHRLALKENHHNQRVLLRVEGNVPEYNIDCRRSDGSFVQMDGVAMVFQSALTEQEEGLYICQASFYHHTATVRIQVEVASEDKHIALASMICASSALAILFILAVTLWVCCKRNGRTHYKKQESISALTSLMQEPGSPEVKKPVVTENLKKEDAQLVSYAIVIDIKSTV